MEPSCPEPATSDRSSCSDAALEDLPPDHFIPVTQFALQDHILQSGIGKRLDPMQVPDAAIQKLTSELIEYMIWWRHQHYRAKLIRLKQLFLVFSPDRDTVEIDPPGPAQKQAMLLELFDELADLMVGANFRKIEEDELNRFLIEKSPYGLDLSVDLDEYEQVLIYARGSHCEPLTKRDWRWLYLKKLHYQVPVFQRLFMMMKLKDEQRRVEEIMNARGVRLKKAQKIVRKKRKLLTNKCHPEHVYLKLFKNIPQQDLEMLFPNTEVRFQLFDKLKLGLTSSSGLIASVFGAISKTGVVSMAGLGLFISLPAAFVSMIVGLGALAFRQVSQFFTKRNEYMMTLAQRLYFHALSDNHGTITLMCDRAEEEDIKEDLLLYHLLGQQAMPVDQVKEYDQFAERYIWENFGVKADFDIDDAVPRLAKDGLIFQQDGMWLPLSPTEALTSLKQRMVEKIEQNDRDADHQSGIYNELKRAVQPVVEPIQVRPEPPAGDRG